jgi:hypothetical protein
MSIPMDPFPGPTPPRDLHDAQLAAGVDSAGVSSKHGGPETVVCTSCGHGSRWHSAAKSCSHRVRWWRRCGCSTYT